MDTAKPALWSRSLIVMIVLVIVTLGLYPAIWFLRRRSALNALDSPVKLAMWPFVVYFAFVFLAFLAGIAAGSLPREERTGFDLMVEIARLAIGILMIVQAFRVKRILEDHLAGPGDTVVHEIGQEPVMLSGLLTFFFSIFYLQYVINHRILNLSTA